MKNIFCAKCQSVTVHKGAVDANGEFVFTCQNVLPDDGGTPCGRFIKFPADITTDEFESKLTEHHEQNKGQVSLEGQEVKLNTLLDAPPAPEVPVETAA